MSTRVHSLSGIWWTVPFLYMLAVRSAVQSVWRCGLGANVKYCRKVISWQWYVLMDWTLFCVHHLSILASIFPGEPGLVGFIAAKDDGIGGDNWSCKTCNGTVKKKLTFYRPDAFLLPKQQCQSTDGKTSHCTVLLTRAHLGFLQLVFDH